MAVVPLLPCSPRGRAPRRASLRALFAIALLLAAAPLSAQVPAGATQAQVLEALRQSGLSQDQVRSRLQQLGRDPGLADSYFNAMRSGATPSGAVNTELLEVMQGIGVVLRDQAAVPTVSGPDTLLPLAPPADEGGLPIFGRSLFRVATSQFQPVTTGPVDPSYRLGPGDQLLAVLTGDVERAYTLEVNREGMIAIPDAGQVYVAGLTLRELEDRLYERLGQVYSGVGRGNSATTQFSLSMGKLRSNQVFLIGEAERPGAYQVSSVASVFDALYMARGPSVNGSFRRIEVRRGGQTVRVVDIYDYLLHGNSADDIRLEQGDVIFIPLVGPQVGVAGAVRRQARFELKGSEGLREVMEFAGGLQAEASVARIQIDRVLPPDQRRPGVDRVLVDVDMRALLGGGAAPALHDNDQISVFSIALERRNRVALAGDVRRPGFFEWTPGVRLWDLIDRAEGLRETAYTARAHVYRLNPEDNTRRLLRTPLFTDSAGGRAQLELSDRDSVVIYSRTELGNPRLVTIAGLVKNPGTIPLAEGMTIRDLVLAAGGFAMGADPRVAEVARAEDISTRTARTSRVFEVSLVGSANGRIRAVSGDTTQAPLVTGAAARGAPTWTPNGQEFVLQDGDVVFIRRSPGYESPRLVTVQGQVLRPGTYVLQTRQERLLDLVNRAGGLTPEAYHAGVRLIRGNRLVATDFVRARRQPGSRFNVVLEPGDSISVPAYDPTVTVTGSVVFESRLLYDPRLRLADYINRAGGYADHANRSRVSVTAPDGERSTVRRSLIFSSVPRVPPGSTIYVPTRAPEDRTDWGEAITRAVSVISAAATVWIAISRL